MRSSHFLALGAALLLSACEGERANEAIATDNQAENALNETMGNATAPVHAAADFAAAVAASDLYEIESGQLAADKANSAELKSFAQMLVADHQKSTADLKAAAGSLNPPVTIAPMLDQEKLTMIDQLKKAPAGQFDQAFIDQQKQAHRKALDLLTSYQQSGDSQPLKDFAAKAAPVVQAHLDKLDGIRP